MTNNKPGTFAVCINNADYPAALEKHKLYRVIDDRDAEKEGDLRIVDESGEDYLYPKEYFIILDLPAHVEQILLQSS